MRLRYITCDVFTDTRFGGNQLAVLPEAEGLTAAQMQRIAHEFNFSESSFVLPPEAGHDRRVRIFTPTQEVPFAGHPNIGTAFVLARTGAFGPLDEPRAVVFEEAAGPVPITIERLAGDRIVCELAAPQGLTVGATVPVKAVATAVSLDPEDILTTVHEPCVASVGLPFLVAELRDRDALERARPDVAGIERLLGDGSGCADLHVYVRSPRAAEPLVSGGGERSGSALPADEAGPRRTDGFDIRARMFSPLDGIPEDPATGSANCALVALLTHLDPAADGAFRWRIAQGVEMGRPSVLEARSEKRGGEVANVWIGGECVLVCDGHIEV